MSILQFFPIRIHRIGKKMDETCQNQIFDAAADGGNNTKETRQPLRTKNNKYLCETCNAVFNQKKNLNSHEKTCRLIHLTKSEKNAMIDNYNDTTPSVRDLYMAVKLLTDKVIDLEKEIVLLKNANKQKRPIEILNAYYIPQKPYIEWLNDLRVRREHLETVFEYNLSEGMIKLISEYEVLPIKLFYNKRKIFVFSQEENQFHPCWNDTMKEEEFEKFIDILCGRFIREFILWENENMAKIEEDPFLKERYLNYTKKIMVTPITREKVYCNVRRWIQSIKISQTNSAAAAAAAAISKEAADEDA